MIAPKDLICDHEKLKIWQVPAIGEHPSDEFVDWLNEFDNDLWDGDDSGISIHNGLGVGGGSQIAEPGEFVLWNPDLGLRVAHFRTTVDIIMKRYAGDK